MVVTNGVNVTVGYRLKMCKVLICLTHKNGDTVQMFVPKIEGNDLIVMTSSFFLLWSRLIGYPHLMIVYD